MKGQSTKDLIVECATQLLAREGFGGFSMRRVANAAEMSLGNLQYHFRTKDMLLHALAEVHFSRCTAALNEALELDGTPCEQLRFALTSLLPEGDSLDERALLTRELISLAGRDENVGTIFREHIEVCRTHMMKIIGPLVSVDDECRVQSGADFVLAMIQGYAQTYPSIQPPTTDTIERQVCELVRD